MLQAVAYCPTPEHKYVAPGHIIIPSSLESSRFLLYPHKQIHFFSFSSCLMFILFLPNWASCFIAEGKLVGQTWFGLGKSTLGNHILVFWSDIKLVSLHLVVQILLYSSLISKWDIRSFQCSGTFCFLLLFKDHKKQKPWNVQMHWPHLPVPLGACLLSSWSLICPAASNTP